MGAHGLQNRQCGVQIVAVVEQRLFDRLADSLEPGKVNDTGNVIIGKQLIHRGLVAAVRLDEDRTLAGDFLDAVDDLRGAVVQIVDDDDILPRVQQGNGGMAADKTGAADCAVFKVQFRHILIPSFMGYSLLYQIFSPFGRGFSRFSL